jgi:cell division protein FtsB
MSTRPAPAPVAPVAPVHDRHRERLRPRPHGVPAARRVSGPAHPAAYEHPAAMSSDSVLVAPLPRPDPQYRPAPPRGPQQSPPLRLAAGGAAIALRVGETAMQVSASRFMDRVVRSRAWVVIVGFGLIGIVAMQVSMLKLNSGIGRAVDTVATLERSNATLKADISRLSSGDRIQAAAGLRGFSMPEPADVTYLTAGDLRSDGVRAARRMRAPDAAIAGPAGALTAASVSDSLTGDTQTGSAAATAAAAPAAEPPATTAPLPATTDPAAAATTPAATTAPATTATTAPVTNGAAVPPPATAQSTGPIAPQATSSGGVTTP